MTCKRAAFILYRLKNASTSKERFNLTTASGREAFRAAASRAEFYSDNLSDEVKKGLHEKAEQGRWVGTSPYGYDQDATGVLQPNADAPTLQLAFALFKTGTYTVAAASEELNRRGFTTVGNFKDRSAGRRQRVPFSERTLRAMLKNRAYIGEVTCKDQVHTGQHDPLIDVDTFKAVQRIFAQRSTWKGVRVQRDDAILSGVVWCAACGAKAHVGRTASSCPRYRCSHHRRCQQPYVRGDVAEPMLWTWLSRLVIPDDLRVKPSQRRGNSSIVSNP